MVDKTTQVTLSIYCFNNLILFQLINNHVLTICSHRINGGGGVQEQCVRRGPRTSRQRGICKINPQLTLYCLSKVVRSTILNTELKILFSYFCFNITKY